MLAMYSSIRNWLKSEEGQDLAEYGLLLGFLAVVVMISLLTLGYYLLFYWSVIGESIAVWISASAWQA